MSQDTLTFSEYLQHIEDGGKPFLSSWPEGTRDYAQKMVCVHLAFLLLKDGKAPIKAFVKPGVTELARYPSAEWQELVEQAVKEFMETVA